MRTLLVMCRCMYAKLLIDRVIQTAYLLEEQPLMGREVPEAEREDMRELIFQSYPQSSGRE